MEKFAAKKANRFLAQGDRLTLAALELIYLWNGYTILGNNFDAIYKICSIIDKERQRLEAIPINRECSLLFDWTGLFFF